MDLEPIKNLKTEKSTNCSEVQKQLGELAKVLVKYNLRNTLKTLVKESSASSFATGKKTGDDSIVYELKGNMKSKIQYLYIDSIIAEKYFKGFSKLYNFIDSALDAYKQELSILLLPILSRIYLKFLKINNREGRDIAVHLCKQYHFDEGYFPGDTVLNLMALTRIEHVELNFAQAKIRMSMEVFKYFQTCFRTPGLISEIITKELAVQIYVGGAKFYPKLHANVVHLTNSKRICFGLSDPTPLHGEDDDSIEDEESVKRKRGRRRQTFQRWDPNAPQSDRIPLPSSPRTLDKILGFIKHEGTRRTIQLSRYTLPSVCCYTALNSQGSITCAEISEDGLMLAVGFRSSGIRVWSLSPWKLRNMKSFEELNALNRDMPEVTSFLLDEKSGDTIRYLYGHNGCVYRVNFSPDQNLLLSCSEDGTVRLWSLLSWQCVCIYKGHCSPVWDARFSPHGYYFVSCSYDKTARLWGTDSLKPFRIFAGHIADVNCVVMHPNSNYVATGSTDCSVRIWDVANGKCMRIMLDHKTAVYALVFSNCGSYLVSGARDGEIKVWEMRRGLLIGNLDYHKGTIYSFCFSREGNLLAASGSDCRLTLWDFTKLIDDLLPDEFGNPKQANVNSSDGGKKENEPPDYLLRTFPSKWTPFYSLIFTRRNLLLAMGPYLPPYQYGHNIFENFKP